MKNKGIITVEKNITELTKFRVEIAKTYIEKKYKLRKVADEHKKRGNE